MKILIVGIGRSGTTFTYRAFRSHPQIKKAFLEHCILCLHKDRASLERKEPCFKGTCCEKINYTTDKIFRNASPKRGFCDVSIDEYCQMWIDWFGKEARIIQIIRHPLDGIFSLIAKKGRKLKLFRGHKIEMVPQELQETLIERYLNACRYPEKIASLPQTMTVNYENLIRNKETLQNIYKFCNLKPFSFNEYRRNARVFGYKRSGFQIEQPIDHILKVYNKIGGIQYE